MVYDYVIVGGGSSGCVLASRLSELPDARVLLLEAGPADTDRFIHLPVGFYRMTAGPLTWGYRTAPLGQADGREMIFPQGRVLGGGSSINAMVYARGHALDYDEWAREEGCVGWSYADVAALFPPRRGQRALREPLPRHGRAARRLRPDQPALPDPRVRARRSAGRPALQPGLQRRAPGGLRPLPGDPARRPALQRGRGLPQARARARQPHRAHRLPRDPDPGRARPRGRGRVPRGRKGRAQDRTRRAGGGGRERCCRLAQAPAPVRHRPGRRAPAGRRHAAARPAGRRPQPAGPHRRLRDLRARRAAQLRPPHPAAPDALGRRPVPVVRQRPGDLEPRRGRRLLVRRPRAALARHPVPLPARRRASRPAFRRSRAMAARSTPAICGRAAAAASGCRARIP